MRYQHWVGLFFFIAFSLTYPACTSESGITITGTINNIDKFNIEPAYLQLIKLNEKNTVEKATAIVDIHDNMVGALYISELPKVSISSNGSVIYKIDQLSPGNYILAVQNYIRKDAGSFRCSHPLVNDKNNPLILNITEKNKPPFTCKFGNVSMRFSDKGISLDFNNPVMVTP